MTDQHEAAPNAQGKIAWERPELMNVGDAQDVLSILGGVSDQSGTESS